MSPAPFSDSDAPLSLVLPAAPTSPTSLVCHRAGNADGAGDVTTDTLSNIAEAACPTAWLVTATPTSRLPPHAIDCRPTSVHAAPSTDVDALTIDPARDSFSQRGAAPAAAVDVVAPPVVFL